MNILIIDDDPSYTAVVRLVLEREGYKVLSLEGCPNELKEYLKIHEVDLLLLDRVMPEPDGIAVLRLLRETSPSIQIPVILTSASENISDIDQALDLGADRYIYKMLPPKELLDQVRACLSAPKTDS